jgi:signal transduction histidine kinase
MIRNSLLLKLLGALLLVIIIGASLYTWLTARATQTAFNLYTTRNGQAWAEWFAPNLADFYVTNGGWQGVEAFLDSGISVPSGSGMMGNGNGPGMRRGMGAGWQSGMWGMMGQRVVLTDEGGYVIHDSTGELDGQLLSPSQLSIGVPVIANEVQVGTILVTPHDNEGSQTPAGLFLSSVNRSIIISVVVSGMIALILGTFLSVQITAPLRQLKKAAGAIAQGDLSQRVEIHSHDELGELGQTFNRMAENLENVEIQRQHLMADIAHELRTPIAVIQANLEGILDEVLPLDTEQVAGLHDEILLLKRLVDDLRLLSLAEAGELKLVKTLTDIRILISKAVERFNGQAGQKGIILKTEYQDNLPSIWIDSDRITQVINNLISNALRYTPEGGQIFIQANESTDPNSFLEITITDTGAGIDPSALPFVFDRFYRADQSRSRTSGGSGLGLAIVKQLVEAHGGKIIVKSPIFSSENQQEYGTKFLILLAI